MPSAPAITLSGFVGEQPRIIPRLMGDNAAQAAIDTRLDDGGLSPMRETAFISTAGATDWKTIYYYQGSWLGWNIVVDAAPGPVAEDRLYYTGDGAPKMRVGVDVYPLAVNRPSAALAATLGGTGSGDIQTRLYVYTFVTSFGEESEPCVASNSVDWKPGNTVTLSGFQAAPAGRAITLQRIYRSQTGSTGTFFYLIAERAATTANFVDNIPVSSLQEPLPSTSYNAPPDTLKGLTALPNGMMAAFTGKKLYFCEPYRPHAWPEKYALTMESDIVGLGAMGVSLLVATKGQPYLVSGTVPESMTSQKIEQNLPCINERSIVDLGYAIAYASNEGLVVARADGAIGIATGNIFNRDDWEDLSPTTMIGAQLNGRYVAFYSTTLPNGTKQEGALFIDLSGQSFLFRTATTAQAVAYDIGASTLFYVPPGKAQIRQFDAPGAIRRYLYWKSKEFWLPYPENYGAFLIDSNDEIEPVNEEDLASQIAAITAANQALINAGSIGGDINASLLGDYQVNGDMLTPLPKFAGQGTGDDSGGIDPNFRSMTVGIYADKVRVAAVTTANRAIRLPSGFKARCWEIDVYTNARIDHITMAKTMDDLKRTP
jgi:hypothetical protein